VQGGGGAGARAAQQGASPFMGRGRGACPPWMAAVARPRSASGRWPDGPRRARRAGRAGAGRAHGLGPGREG
jgi:hypothetical protein